MKIPLIVVLCLVMAVLVGIGMLYRYQTTSDLSILFGIFSIFLSINLINCLWEICLFLKRDHIEQRAGYWQTLSQETGQSPAILFFFTKVPIQKSFSPTTWSDAWAAYAHFDASFTDRGTFGFNVDVGNGFVSLLPTAVFYWAITTESLPAVVTGMLGLILFWMQTYMTSIYWVSFFMAQRQKHITRAELFWAIGVLNSLWVFVPILGVYVSVMLILNADYLILMS